MLMCFYCLLLLLVSLFNKEPASGSQPSASIWYQGFLVPVSVCMITRCV